MKLLLVKRQAPFQLPNIYHHRQGAPVHEKGNDGDRLFPGIVP